MTITSAEAAEILGLTTASIRSLVFRGDLAPVRPGARPLRFVREAVIELEWRRRSPSEKARAANVARRLRTERAHATMYAPEEVRPGRGSGAFRASGEA